MLLNLLNFYQFQSICRKPQVKRHVSNDVHISGDWERARGLCRKIPAVNFKQPVVQRVQHEPQSCPRHRGACCALPKSGAGPFEPGGFYRLIVQAASASLRGDVTAFQTADKWLSCCSRWAASWRLFLMAGRRAQTSARRRGSADMCAQPNGYTGRAVLSTPLLWWGVFWEVGGIVSSNVLGINIYLEQHLFEMLEICLLAHMVWLQWRWIAGLSYAGTGVALLLLFAVDFAKALLRIYTWTQWKATLSFCAVLRVWKIQLGLIMMMAAYKL